MAANTASSPGAYGATPASADMGYPLKQIIDKPDANTTYICDAAPGTASSAAAWRIKKIVTAGSLTTIGYAGTGAFDQIADNRAALNY
jgi:hypothetical protein